MKSHGSKQTFEALKEGEERYRTILESIEEAYFEVDIEGNFTFFNDALPKILGYSKDELMGIQSARGSGNAGSGTYRGAGKS